MIEKSKRQKLPVKVLKFFIVAIICVGAFYTIKSIGISELKNIIGEHKIFAPIIYIICFCVLPIFLFPVPILAIVAGALFGLFMGSFYTILGAMINSVLMFYVAKFLGSKFISNFIQNSNYKLLYSLNQNKHMFNLILILRLMPLVPYNVLNYACGLMNINIKDYVFATFIGIVPATFIMVNLGEKMLNINSSEFIMACILMILLIFLSNFGAKKLKGGR